MGTNQQLLVDLGERSYPIWIGQGLLEQLTSFLEQVGVQPKQKILLISDSHVAPLYAQQVLQELREHDYTSFLYTIPAGEAAKSFTQYEQIMTFALEHKLDRQSLILALGGGVVGDLAGFVASTFMRGIPFIQIPTTILAHDSSVGGKVAINHPLGKNMIGSFYQPLAVIYDTQTLATLPKREVVSGFAEVLKHAFIWDASFVEWLSTHQQACLNLEEPYLSEALYRGCQIKTFVVAEDEKEENLRAILNFGHTFGHALESLGNYTVYTHGEAIAIGMVFAARLSEKVLGTSNLTTPVSTLLKEYGLPISWHGLPWGVEEVLEKMYADKKVISNTLHFVLLKELGKAENVKGVSPELIKEVFMEGMNSG